MHKHTHTERDRQRKSNTHAHKLFTISIAIAKQLMRNYRIRGGDIGIILGSLFGNCKTFRTTDVDECTYFRNVFGSAYLCMWFVCVCECVCAHLRNKML